jgi:hypothetical protein
MSAKDILNIAGLLSMADIKAATDQKLIYLILSGHYLAGMAAAELESRLCKN